MFKKKPILKYVFISVLLVHGLSHLIGFTKAFFATEIGKQALGISKPIGTLWLIVFILFIVSASSFVNNNKWFYIAFIAVAISQILILMSWGDAKFGTILNLIILLVGISAYGNYRFQNRVDKEVTELLNATTNSTSNVISQKDLQHLPEIVQTWLRNSGVIGKDKTISVRLKQKGDMRTKPNGKWMPFVAIQYFNAENPSFIWNTKVDAMPFITMVGRDKFTNGEGEMLIKLAALIPVVNNTQNPKINSGTMVRYLSEMCWFPSAILNDYISWKAINETSAKATFTYNGQRVSGVFSFTDKGDLVSFEAERYYGGAKDSKLETWLVESLDYKTFNGIRIPNESKVTWKLKEGDFHWLTVEITHITHG